MKDEKNNSKWHYYSVIGSCFLDNTITNDESASSSLWTADPTVMTQDNINSDMIASSYPEKSQTNTQGDSVISEIHEEEKHIQERGDNESGDDIGEAEEEVYDEEEDEEEEEEEEDDSTCKITINDKGNIWDKLNCAKNF